MRNYQQQRGFHYEPICLPGCPGANNDATSGNNGAILSGWNLPMETVTETPCILGNEKLELSLLNKDEYVKLQWTANRLFLTKSFHIERSIVCSGSV